MLDCGTSDTQSCAAEFIKYNTNISEKIAINFVKHLPFSPTVKQRQTCYRLYVYLNLTFITIGRTRRSRPRKQLIGLKLLNLESN